MRAKSTMVSPGTHPITTGIHFTDSSWLLKRNVPLLAKVAEVIVFLTSPRFSSRKRFVVKFVKASRVELIGNTFNGTIWRNRVLNLRFEAPLLAAISYQRCRRRWCTPIGTCFLEVVHLSRRLVLFNRLTLTESGRDDPFLVFPPDGKASLVGHLAGWCYVVCTEVLG